RSPSNKSTQQYQKKQEMRYVPDCKREFRFHELIGIKRRNHTPGFAQENSSPGIKAGPAPSFSPVPR
ncbi:hypothetical protein ACRYWZ_16460, partial [Agrobacterium deltaense]|uniref:hypothetical protein n=1 Tax=Agrobacterium deltaense TaxID=1183412 RepID=UPI003D952C33